MNLKSWNRDRSKMKQEQNKEILKINSSSGLCVSFIEPNIHVLAVSKGEKGEETTMCGKIMFDSFQI